MAQAKIGGKRRGELVPQRHAGNWGLRGQTGGKEVVSI